MNILGGISNGSINPNLWSILCKVRESICIFAPRGKNCGVAPVQPGASNSPPDCCIYMGSIPSCTFPKEKTTQRVVLGRVRESICIFAFGENYGVAPVQPGANNSPPDCCIYMGSIPSCAFPKEKTTQRVVFSFGAGYGNRTRLHGLGSRCITDIRTLRL